MKVKMQKILEAFPALQVLIGMELSGRASYAIAKNVMALNAEGTRFSEKVKEITAKYAKSDDDDAEAEIVEGEQAEESPKEEKPLVVLPENKEKFEREYQDLVEMDVQIQIQKVKFSETDKVLPELLLPIEWMLE